jgi:class 3 adenylate cyclase/tetratricopeptide (TPR) repeat protein
MQCGRGPYACRDGRCRWCVLMEQHCGQCGAPPLGEDDRFCAQCGAPLTGCPACGAPVVAAMRFCTSCGQPLAGAPSAHRPSGPLVLAAPATLGGGQTAAVAERRVCSVLFCDFVGFTPLSESRDPEAVRELLSKYFEVARTIIGRYGGVVEKFIGDAVMAVWGTPVAAEGDAERAVRAGLDLVAAVAQLGHEAGVPGLAARAGMVTGEVAVTFGAPGEGMVAGDAVNTASRVQSVAPPGQLLVDAATRRLAEAAVGFSDAGEHALRGKAEPVQLWRAVRVLAAVGGSQRIDGLEAPLTGRDAELRTIRELFHASVERRAPRLVLVSGPAGVGKSRLGWEFRKYIDGLKDVVWWHEGRCLSYGDGVALWALAQIVRQRLSIAEDDPAETAASKFAAGLDRFVTDQAERAYVGVRLGRLLGVTAEGDDGGPLSREELFAGWRVFFERLAAQAPVVLVVEDAQYADAGLLDFLDHLVDWVRERPVFVLVLARPDLGMARPGFGAGRNRLTLTLDSLDQASMYTLVDALVPGMSASARAKVAGHAQGIPLFAMETIRSLIDRDIVQPSEGVYRLVADIGDLAVPDSLHALLAARLDALDPAVRQLAADAAVLGTSFSAGALAAVSGQDEPGVRTALADLVRREVLTVSADPLSPERGSYQFTQQMLRQVAYDTLSRRDRKARHLAVAHHLRQAYAGDGEEVTDVIARHYQDALDAVPDDPDSAQIRGQAIAALVRAADRASRAGAPAAAAASYAAAAELAVDGPAGSGQAVGTPDAGPLWEKAAGAADTAGDYERAVECAGRAREFHEQHGKERAAARAQVIAAGALRHQGRLGEAREQLTPALEVLRADRDADTVTALGHLAAVEVFAGSPEADRLTAEALALGQALGVGDAELADLLITRGNCHRAERRTEAAAYYREAARIATLAGDNTHAGIALLNLSDALSGTDPKAAAEAGRAAAGQLRRAGARVLLSVATVNLVQALLMAGDWDGADAELTHGADADGLADDEYVAVYRGWLAALRGDGGTAQDTLAMLSGLLASEDLQEQALLHMVRAFISVAAGQPTETLGHARTVLARADALGIGQESVRWAWPVAVRAAHELTDTAATSQLLAQLDAAEPGHLIPMLRAERDLVRARLAARDHAAEGEAFAAAIRGLRDRSTPYHLAHGLLDQAEYLRQLTDTDAAEAAIKEARDIATRLRCQPLLDRIDAISNARTHAPA